MRYCLFSLFFALIIVPVCGCGGSASGATPVTSPATYPNLTGNWNFFLSPSNTLETSFLVGGYLTNSNGSVTGTLHAYASNCYPITQDIPVTGTMTTAGEVSLASGVVSGQTLTISGDMTDSSMSGSYTIAGGCAAEKSGSVAGTVAPPFTNTYSGIFGSVSGVSIGLSVTIEQSGPNADGEYNVNGTATFTGSPCFSSGTITSSTIFGDYIGVTIDANNNGVVQFSGTADVFGATGETAINGTYQVTGGTCAGDFGAGTISTP
jgi:hypothetical protein